MEREIANLVKKSIRELQKEKVLPQFDIPEIHLEHPKEEGYGDYATNAALIISQKVKENPLEIARKIKSKLSSCRRPPFERVEVAGAGFINFFLRKEFFVEELNRLLKRGEKYGRDNYGRGKRVVIDYSSPNIARAFGIGHLRSTIIGQAIYNIYKFLGYKVVGDNHLGDWGTQFGKLIAAIKMWKGGRVRGLSVADLEGLYVRFHRESEEHPEMVKMAREWFKKLEEGEREAREIWKDCLKISRREFERIYSLLGVKIDYSLGESFYRPMLEDIIKEAMKKGIARESQGALIIDYPEGDIPPAMLRKSDGTTTYLTRDLATVKYRLKRWKPELIIYEVGAEQSLHLKQLFRAVEIFGWGKKTRFVHVAHGLYLTKGGRLSTRRGETIHLEDVLSEAVSRAKKIISQSETGRGLSEKEKERVAGMVGIGAIKYNDLLEKPLKNIVFDWEKILNLRGNSGPYLQYTFARCQSVLLKSKTKIIPGKMRFSHFNQEEEAILREIYRFPQVVRSAAERFSPNLICGFLFALSQKYNLLYGLHPILKAREEEKRLLRLSLTKAVAHLLKSGLTILGISVSERM